MLSLLLASLFFVGIHLFISGTRLRDRLVARLGERGFLAFFSLLSLVGLIWMIWAYAAFDDPAVLWGRSEALVWVALVLVLLGFLLAVPGLLTPSPTSVGGERLLEGPEPARGILRVTRHPFLWGVVLWALAHLLVNGDVASLILFGAFLILALYGPVSIDHKRERAVGEPYRRFEAVTSRIPFAAIAAGHNRLVLGEIGWWRLLLGLVVFLVLLWAHEWLFGAVPYP